MYMDLSEKYIYRYKSYIVIYNKNKLNLMKDIKRKSVYITWLFFPIIKGKNKIVKKRWDSYIIIYNFSYSNGVAKY